MARAACECHITECQNHELIYSPSGSFLMFLICNSSHAMALLPAHLSHVAWVLHFHRELSMMDYI